MADAKSSFPKFTQKPVTTPACVARFPAVHKPDAYKDNKPKFKITAVFEGDADLKAIEAAALSVAAQVYPTRKPEKVNVLIKSGDDIEKDGEPVKELAGKFVLNASCNKDYPPKIVGPDRKPLPEGVEVRGGDVVKLILSPIPSDTPIKGTITFRLMAVQLIEKRSGGSGVDVDTMFEDEGEGFGSGPADGAASKGVDAGAGADENDLPF